MKEYVWILLETKPAAVWFHLTGENPDVTV